MTILDTHVTFSAGGDAAVIAAFNNVAAAAKKSGKDGSQGVALLTAELEKLKGLLPAIGIGAAATGIVMLAKHALESADAVGKLAQKTGLSSETLSVLAYGATKAGVEFQSFEKGLGLFNKTMANLDHGNAAAAASVRRLLGDSAALNGLDTEARFKKVVEALAQMPAGYEKTRAAQEMFGRAGMELLPLLDQLGAGGFAKLRARALELGLVMSTDMTAAAMRASESLRDLKAEAQGAATQFVSGLTPALADAAEAMTKATTGGGTNGLQLLGQGVGAVAKGIIGAFVLVGESIGFVFGEATLLVEEWGRKAINAITNTADKAAIWIAEKTGNGEGPQAAWHRRSLARTQAEKVPDYSAGASARADAFSADILKQMNALFPSAPPAPMKKKPTAEGGSAPNDTLMKGQVAALKAGLADQLAVYKAQDELLAAQQKRAYDAGQLSIADYYAARIAAIKTSVADEVLALQEEYYALAKAPLVTAGKSSDQVDTEKLARETELAALRNRIQVATLNGQKQIAEEQDKQHKDEKAFNEYRLEIESKIQAAQGNTYAAALAAIDKADAEAMAKAKDDPAAQAAVARLTALQKARALLDDIDRQGNLAMGGLSDVHAGLQTGVAAGDLFPFQALERYDAAVQAALPHLRELAAEMRARAVTPEDIQKAAQFSNTVEQMGATSSETARQLAQLRQGIESGLQGAFTSFFSTGIDQAHSFGEAMSTLALDVVRSLQQIAAQMLATLATQKLLGSGASGGSGSGWLGGLLGLLGLGKSAGSGMGLSAADYGYAAGGFITGPGTGTSDSIPAMLSAGEFVMRARAVQQPGMLAQLQQINQGMQWPAFRTPGSYRTHFAEGGLVAGAALEGGGGGGGNAAHVIVSLSEGLVANHIESGPGSRAVIRTIGDNRNAVKAALGVK